MEYIGAKSGGKRKHLSQQAQRFKGELLQEELDKLSLKVEVGRYLAEGSRTPKTRGQKQRVKTDKHPRHFPPGIEELAPKLRPIPEGARRISDMSGLGVYHWIGSPREISGGGLSFY